MKSLALLTLNSLGENYLNKSEKCAFGKPTVITEKHPLVLLMMMAFDNGSEVLWNSFSKEQEQGERKQLLVPS